MHIFCDICISVVYVYTLLLFPGLGPALPGGKVPIRGGGINVCMCVCVLARVVYVGAYCLYDSPCHMSDCECVGVVYFIMFFLCFYLFFVTTFSNFCIFFLF